MPPLPLDEPLRLAAGVELLDIGEHLALLRGGPGDRVVSDPIRVQILRRLRDPGSVRALWRSWPDIPAAELLYGVTELSEGGWLAPVARPGRTVRLLGDGDAAPLREALAAAEIREDDDAPLSVVVIADTASAPQDMLDRGSEAWIPLVLERPRPWWGPILRRGGGICWRCLRGRLALRQIGRASTPVRPADPATQRALHALFALWLRSAPDRAGDPAIFVFDPATLGARRWELPRDPGCPSCGAPDQGKAHMEAPVSPRTGLRCVSREGGLRVASPGSVLERLEVLLNPVTGPVVDDAPVSGADRPWWVHRASGVAPAPRGEGAPRVVLASGKGPSPLQARVSALAELVERLSAHARGDEPLVYASALELGEAAIPPDALLPFSAAQRADPGEPPADPRRAVVASCPPDAVIPWVPAWSLTHRTRRHLPASYCLVGLERGDAPWACPANPNGVAAGSCLEEALLQGFLELVERDAAALWWYNRIPRPDGASDADTRERLESTCAWLAGQGWDAWLLDLSADLGIAVRAAVAMPLDPAVPGLTVGLGCHLDPRIAGARALSELAQLHHPRRRPPPPWDADALQQARRWLLPSLDAAPCRAAPPPGLGDDPGAAVLTCVSIARRAGLEVIALDLSRPELRLAVTRVVVPGLRHFWPQLGQGRLHDVPVALGWLERPREEGALNGLPTPW